MSAVLAAATVLGGVAAIWFFWDKIVPWFTRPAPALPDPQITDIDLDYVEASGLGPRLRSEGFRLYWAAEDRLRHLLDLEGWQLVIETKPDGRRLRYRIKDPICDLHLIQKREKPAA